eukprot:1081863-Rhodomonas_salina.1
MLLSCISPAGLSSTAIRWKQAISVEAVEQATCRRGGRMKPSSLLLKMSQRCSCTSCSQKYSSASDASPSRPARPEPRAASQLVSWVNANHNKACSRVRARGRRHLFLGSRLRATLARCSG